MATSTTTLNSAASDAVASSQWTKIAIPYAIAIASQIPMMLLYFRDLWSLPHYRFFPFAILATAAFAYLRWPTDLASPFQRSRLSDLLLLAGLFFGLLTVVFQSQWCAAVSVMVLVASLLVRTIDGETLGSLGAASLPLFTCLMIPNGGDIRLITWLQRVSSSVTSMILDLIGLKHYLSGVVIKVPGTTGYEVEAMCSGVQSFFTLLFFAVVLIVFFRRTFVRGFLLIAAAIFWSVFMNTARIVAIPISEQWLGIDLAHGLKHDLLGYSVLITGILLLVSTDQLIQFVLGPQSPDGGVFARLTKVLTSGKKQKRKRRNISKGTKGLLWTTAGMLALCGVVQVGQVGTALADPKTKISFFDPDVTVPFEEGDVPTEIGNWRKFDYQFNVRNRAADLGQRSDGWQFRAPRCQAYVSLDQTFPGWHELTTCYRNAGWELIKRERVDPNAALLSQDGARSWPYVEATFKRETGEHAYLLFSLFDARGESIDPPASWGGLGAFLIRLQGRIAHQWRSKLFQSEAYQTQVLVQTPSEMDDDLKNEVRDRYFVVREAIRRRFLEKQNLVTADAAKAAAPKPAAVTEDVFGQPSAPGSSDFPF